jgi:DNA (cytosine-5)-methyltransferase 1
MRIGSLFSGIGGLELGLERSGLGATIWQVEIDPFARKVLAKHWPDVPRYEDVRLVGAHNLEPVDVICGGFPCQDVSSAGKKVGLDGAKSGLWTEFCRIIGEMLPRYAVVENVKSGKNRWLCKVRQDLHLLGYDSTAIEISAASVGAPHRRDRVFVIANAYDQGKPTVSKYAETLELSNNADSVRNSWLPPPTLLRMDDGVSGGLDRLRVLGNAVVPQCAEEIGKALLWALT